MHDCIKASNPTAQLMRRYQFLFSICVPKTQSDGGTNVADSTEFCPLSPSELERELEDIRHFSFVLHKHNVVFFHYLRNMQTSFRVNKMKTVRMQSAQIPSSLSLMGTITSSADPDTATVD